MSPIGDCFKKRFTSGGYVTLQFRFRRLHQMELLYIINLPQSSNRRLHPYKANSTEGMGLPQREVALGLSHAPCGMPKSPSGSAN